MQPEHLAALAALAGCQPDGARPEGGVNPIVRYLADALRFYMEFHSRNDHFYGAFIHDPLALAAALDPTLVRTEAVTVDVELGGRLTTGENRDGLAPGVGPPAERGRGGRGGHRPLHGSVR